MTSSQTQPTPAGELKELKDGYFNWMSAAGVSPYTIDCVSLDFQVFFEFLASRGIIRIADVTPERLTEYRAWLGERDHPQKRFAKFSDERMRDNQVAIRNFFRWLAGRMMILLDPTEMIEFPNRPPCQPKLILTLLESRQFLDAIDLRGPIGYRDRAMFEVLYATGIRAPELFGLTVADVDLAARSIVVNRGKVRGERTLPIPASVTGYLKEYLEKVRPLFSRFQDAGCLFLNQTGSAVDVHAVRYAIRRTQKVVKIDKHIGAGTFRRSLATHLLESGMMIREIQEFLGRNMPGPAQKAKTRVTLPGLQEHYARQHSGETTSRSPVEAPLPAPGPATA